MARLPRLPSTAKSDVAADAAKSAKAQDDTREIVKPLATMILADVALRAGQSLVRKGVLGGLLGRQMAKAADKKGGRVIQGRSIGHTLIGTALARVATGSVPGAIVVGGGLLAKTLFDRKRAKAAKAKADEIETEKP